MTIDKADKTYTGCDKCVHANDSEDVCRARLCIHAINCLKECYKPVRPRGHWIKVITEKRPNAEVWHFKCSECGEWEFRADFEHDKFCPNCGAKMEESDDLL